MTEILLDLQSARDAMTDCVERLESAYRAVDHLEEHGQDSPVPYGEVERALSTARILQRNLEKLLR